MSYKVLLVLLVLGLTACEHANLGIFYQLENERKIEQANEGTGGYPTAMIRTTVNNQPRYYLSANRLFWRNVAAQGQDWNEVASPNGYQNIGSITEGIDASTLLVSATSNSSARSGLFLFNIQDNTWGNNLFNSNAITNEPQQIVRLFSVMGNGGRRHIVIGRSVDALGSYSVWHYNSKNTATTNDDELVSLWNEAQIIAEAQLVAGGSDYRILLLAETGIYCVQDNGGAANTALQPLDGGAIYTAYNQPNPSGMNLFELRRMVLDSTETTDRDAIRLGGIYFDDAHNVNDTAGNDRALYISGGRGAVYRYMVPSGSLGAVCSQSTAWKNGCADNSNRELDCWYKSNFNNTNYAYTDLIWFNGVAENGGLVLGVRDNGAIEGGYREVAAGDIASIQNPQGTSYQSAGLSGTSVLSWYVDSTSPNLLFALTEGSGVWRGAYSNGVPEWSRDFSR